MTSDDQRVEKHVFLKILSEHISPENIVEMIGLKVDKTWKQGDFRGKSKIKERMNGVSIGSRLDDCEELENHILDLFDRISGTEEVIKSLSSDNTVQLSCAIYAEVVPSLYFENEIMRKISDIGASFDIDLYLLPPGNGTNE